MKKRMKWLLLLGGILVLGTVSVLAFALSGGRDRVIRHDGYEVIKKDGKCYISLYTDDHKMPSEVDFGAIRFSSVSDMKQSIEKGKLSQEQLQDIKRYMGVDGTWEICDLDNLHDVRVPDGVSARKVRLSGNLYDIGLVGDFSLGFIRCCDELYYKEEFQEYYLNSPGGSARIIREEKEEDRNATVIYYENGAGEFKIVKYTILQEGRTLYVIEKYVLTAYSSSLEASDTEPREVRVYEEKDGGYCEIWLSELKKRPSVEWLTSFELVPLKSWF